MSIAAARCHCCLTPHAVISNLLICASYATGENYLLEKYSRPIWGLLMTHHVCAILFCALGLFYGDATPRGLACTMLISLLGTTGAMHLIGIALDLTPLSIEDAPMFRFGYQVATLASMVWFRALYWMVLVYQMLSAAYAGGGLATAIFSAVVMLLFTAFNADFM